MRRITNRSEFDELIEKISECIEFYEKNKFNEKIYNLLLEQSEKIKELEQINAEYQERENTIKRVLSMQ